MRGENVLKLLQGMARWYLRRRRIVRILIFLVIFVLPMFMYAYMKAPHKEEIIREAENMTMVPENPLKLNFRTIPFYTLTSGRVVFYIGNFKLYGSSIYIVNSTTYLYYHDKHTIGLLLDLSGNDTTIFVLTDKVNMTYKNFTISYVTLLLPGNTIPTNIPSWTTTIICKYVGNETNPYNAWKEKTLPSIYDEVCS